jgi:hypothetical protein
MYMSMPGIKCVIYHRFAVSKSPVGIFWFREMEGG